MAPEQSGESTTLYSARTIRGLYPALRDDHLRYLERWGLVRAVRQAQGHGRHETLYSFADLAVIRQASAELARGLTFRSVLRALVAEREGQLAFDFQPVTGRGGDTANAKVVKLEPRVAAGQSRASRLGAQEPLDEQTFERAARYFAEGAALDGGEDARSDEAMVAYRRALTLDPQMVAALVNLANLHYAADAIIEAEALYEKALALDPSCFEAHFNLGNVYHDTGRFEAAVFRYRQALAIDPGYADAHFYLAVTLEKLGRSGEARPHWAHYQRLAPNGEWVALAKEFGE